VAKAPIGPVAGTLRPCAAPSYGGDGRSNTFRHRLLCLLASEAGDEYFNVVASGVDWLGCAGIFVRTFNVHRRREGTDVVLRDEDHPLQRFLRLSLGSIVTERRPYFKYRIGRAEDILSDA
jgi:hypothetical protein